MKIKTNPYSNFNGIFSDKYVIGGEKYSTTMQTYTGEYYLPNAGLSEKIPLKLEYGFVLIFISNLYIKKQNYKTLNHDHSQLQVW